MPSSERSRTVQSLMEAIVAKREPCAGKASSVALCHQIRSIDKTRIGKELGVLSPQDLATVEEGVRRVHGL